MTKPLTHDQTANSGSTALGIPPIRRPPSGYLTRREKDATVCLTVPRTFRLGWEMSSAMVIAVVGVCGTLASAIITQMFSQRSRNQELEAAERRRLAEQETAEKQRKIDQLRSCYVQLNANDRNYRDAMLAYAYALKAGSSGEAEAAEVATARRAQRDARAEAQMIVSEEVLDNEGRVNARLIVAYRSLQQIPRESDAS